MFGVVLLIGVVDAWLSLVLDVSVELLVLVNVVVDDLSPAVGKLNPVLSLYVVSLPGLGSGVDVGVAVLIILVDVVSKSIVFLQNVQSIISSQWSIFEGVVSPHIMVSTHTPKTSAPCLT